MDEGGKRRGDFGVAHDLTMRRQNSDGRHALSLQVERPLVDARDNAVSPFGAILPCHDADELDILGDQFGRPVRHALLPPLLGQTGKKDLLAF